MADGPDPLGKRLLFWVPPDERSAGERPADRRGGSDAILRRRSRGVPAVDAGRRSLFSSAPASGSPAPPARRSRPVPPAASPAAAPGQAEGTGAEPGRAASVAPGPAATAEPGRETPPGGPDGRTGPSVAAADAGAWPAIPGAGWLRRIAPVRLVCATCGTTSVVDVVRFAALHAPVFVWRPGRGFTRLMTCPACRRRSWISASWPAAQGAEPGA